MSEAAQELVDEVAEAPDAPVEVPAEESTEAPVQDYSDDPFLAMAEEMGYRNPATWKGEPPGHGFKSPEQFIRDTVVVNKTMRQSNSALEGRIDSMQQTLQDLAVTQTKELKAVREKTIKELMAKREKAFDEGDKETFNRVEQELNSVHQEPVPEPQQPTVDPRFAVLEKDFRQKYDQVLDQQVQEEIEIYVRSLPPGLSPDDFFDRVETRLNSHIKRIYPEKFGVKPAAPSAGGETSKSSPRSEWGKLTKEFPDAEQAFKSFVERGVFEDTKADRERYAKSVNEDE